MVKKGEPEGKYPLSKPVYLMLPAARRVVSMWVKSVCIQWS